MGKGRMDPADRGAPVPRDPDLHDRPAEDDRPGPAHDRGREGARAADLRVLGRGRDREACAAAGRGEDLRLGVRKPEGEGALVAGGAPRRGPRSAGAVEVSAGPAAAVGVRDEAMNPDIDAERQRLDEADRHGVAWRRWGPYLSERQWGTVREDYSASGDAWSYFTHDQARSRAYRWGEDGIAGISDDKQRLCFALALWNGRDPILKERMFGLTNAEGNHGEDVKEYYFYLDSTPAHSYMRYLYKYPQRAFPYEDLVRTNRERSRRELEYELIDTGIFDDDRY